MAITLAVKKDNRIHVYDGNRLLFSKFGDAVVGYTANSVSIKEGNRVRTYNEKGSLVSATFA